MVMSTARSREVRCSFRIPSAFLSISNHSGNSFMILPYSPAWRERQGETQPLPRVLRVSRPRLRGDRTLSFPALRLRAGARTPLPAVSDSSRMYRYSWDSLGFENWENFCERSTNIHTTTNNNQHAPP